MSELLHDVFIGIGSNLGDRLGYCRKAVDRIASLPCTSVSGQSSVYESNAVTIGKSSQPSYLNLVVRIETSYGERDLLTRLMQIETALGRVRGKKWGPRCIDLDILFFGDHIVEEIDLIIPHPELAKRRFVLKPLLELCENFKHPALRKNIRELYDGLEDSHSVEIYSC